MAKKKPICVCDEKNEDPRQLQPNEVLPILEFLTGIVHVVVGSKVSVDEAIALHKLIGKEYLDPKGRPYWIDESYALDVLTDLGKRGSVIVKRLSKKRKEQEAVKCARTTNSTKRKASKRKNV